MTIFTIVVWSGLVIYALYDDVILMRKAASFAVFFSLSVFLLISFEVARFADLPFRSWIISWSIWIVASWKSRFPLVFVAVLLGLSLLGLGVHDVGALIYCQYQKNVFLDRLSSGWSERHNDDGAKLIGRANALFPNRPEPYFVYQSARRSYAEQSNKERATTIKEYARAFLNGYEMDDSMGWYPIFFCCSCRPMSYFRLLPRIVMVESHDYTRATKHKPEKDDRDAYLLWLYHMSERKDIDFNERENIYEQMKEITSVDTWNNSPVYPSIVDHVMQGEYLRAKHWKSECPVEKMWKYTEDIIHRYKTIGDESPIIPPNKTLVYYILKQIYLDQKDLNAKEIDIRTPFTDLRNVVKELLNDCSDYRKKFHNNYTNDEIENIINILSGLVQPLGNDEKIKTYLTTAKTKDWLEFCLFKCKQRP